MEALGALVVTDHTVELDGEGFSDWYRHHYRRVYAVALATCRSRELAQEATDEAFVRAAERWSRVGAMASPAGWACRVAANEAKRLGRRASRQTNSVESASVELGSDLDLWSAVSRLPRRQREAVALRYIADLTEDEVAKTMGISPGAASATLSSARARLASTLGADAEGGAR